MDEQKPTTPSTEAGGIPKGLEKFAGADGKLDVQKLSQSYLETEHMAHEATQKRADAERAYAILAQEREQSAYRGAAGRTEEADDLSERPVTQADTAPVVQAFIETIHPEIAVDTATGKPKNQQFVDGLRVYVGNLPVAVKKAIANGDFAMQDWAIKQYKAISGAAQKSAPGASAQGEKPNFIEGASPSVGDGKKIWTSEEIKNLYKQNPKEYARLADTEIAEAYSEGRVK